MNRRGFLTGIGLVFATPAIIRVDNLMRLSTFSASFHGAPYSYILIDSFPIEYLTAHRDRLFETTMREGFSQRFKLNELDRLDLLGRKSYRRLAIPAENLDES